MNKPTLKLDFADFNGIDKSHNWFTKILRKDFDVVISDRPHLLIFQEGGHLNRLYTCKKLFWTGESIYPDWTRTDYAMTCHYIDSPRHLRFPYYVWGAEAGVSDLMKMPGDAEKVLGEKRKFCSAVVSNGNRKRARERADFLLKLMSTLRVDSAGKYLNNYGALASGGTAKMDFIRRYKFNFCYENKNLPGYTTEKLIQAMWARCIPIYWGNDRLGEEFNTRSLLHRNAFTSDESFIDAILEVDSDASLYRHYLNEPFFHDNKPNLYYDFSRLLNFFHQILDDNSSPVSHRRRWFSFGRWTLAKRHHYY